MAFNVNLCGPTKRLVHLYQIFEKCSYFPPVSKIRSLLYYYLSKEQLFTLYSSYHKNTLLTI
nr:MAG TPA: hypothetical protein [Caudoviricetes sp.]